MAQSSITRIGQVSPPPPAFSDRGQYTSYTAVRDSQAHDVYDYGASAVQGRPRSSGLWGRSSSGSQTRAASTAPTHSWYREPHRKERKMGIHQYDEKQQRFFQEHLFELGPCAKKVLNHCSTSSKKSLFQRLCSIDHKLIRRELRHELKRERKLSTYKDLRWVYSVVFETEFPSQIDRDGDFCMLEIVSEDDEPYGTGPSAAKTAGTSYGQSNLPNTSTLESWGFTSSPSPISLPAIPQICIQPPSPQVQVSELPPPHQPFRFSDTTGIFSNTGWPFKDSQGNQSDTLPPPHSPVPRTVPLP